MTTKLYLHSRPQTSTGTLPQTIQNTTDTQINTGADLITSNHAMDKTIGVAQATIAITTDAVVNLRHYYFGKWVSPPLDQFIIAANTWTFNIAAATSFSSGAFGSGIKPYIYIWRPSTGKLVGWIAGPTAPATTGYANVGAINSERAENGTVTGVAVTCQPADVLVVELGVDVTQGAASAATDTVYFDGTTEQAVTNTVVSSQASLLSTPENLNFGGSLSRNFGRLKQIESYGARSPLFG